MADGRTRWNGPARREERSFQAVTRASTNAPSVGGAAGPRPRARGWRSPGRAGPRRRGPGRGSPGWVPGARGPEVVGTLTADRKGSLPAPPTAVSEPRSLFVSSLSKRVLRNELYRLRTAVGVNFLQRTSSPCCLTVTGSPWPSRQSPPGPRLSLISPQPSPWPMALQPRGPAVAFPTHHGAPSCPWAFAFSVPSAGTRLSFSSFGTGGVRYLSEPSPCFCVSPTKVFSKILCL